MIIAAAVGGLLLLAVVAGVAIVMKKRKTKIIRAMTAQPVVPAPAQPAAQPQDTLAALRDLKGLLDDGTLTQEEFDAQKKVMLGRREKI